MTVLRNMTGYKERQFYSLPFGQPVACTTVAENSSMKKKISMSINYNSSVKIFEFPQS